MDYPQLPEVYFERREPAGRILGIPYGGTVFLFVDHGAGRIRVDLTNFSVNTQAGGFYPTAFAILPPRPSPTYPSLPARLPGFDP